MYQKQGSTLQQRPVPGSLDLRARSEGPDLRTQRSDQAQRMVTLEAFIGEDEPGLTHRGSLEAFLGEQVPSNPFSGAARALPQDFEQTRARPKSPFARIFAGPERTDCTQPRPKSPFARFARAAFSRSSSDLR